MIIFDIHIYIIYALSSFLLVLRHACILFSIFPREQGLVSTSHSALPVASLIHSLQKLLVAVAAFVPYRLLLRAKSTKHGDSFDFLMDHAGFHNMAIITTEASTATAVSEPSKR